MLRGTVARHCCASISEAEGNQYFFWPLLYGWNLELLVRCELLPAIPGAPTGEEKPLQKKVGFFIAASEPETVQTVLRSGLVNVPLNMPRIETKMHWAKFS
jgi:hypothetical protein